MSLQNPFANRFVLLFLICFLSLNSTITIAEWNVDMNINQQFPSPYISDWENNPTIGSLTITNPTSSQTDVLIYLTISHNTMGVIAAGNNNPITTLPGIPTQINSDRFIDWNTVTYNGNMQDQLIQTGRLPEGDYSACVTVKDLGGATLASNICKQFTIVYPSPPSLFYPADGEQLTSNYPIFTWTPVQVPPKYQLKYILKIAEMLPGQTPNQALLANTVQYEDDNLLSTNLQYPVSALPFEPGKTYAWQVKAVDQDGFSPSSNQGRSEIWTFVTPDILNQSPPTPTASTTPLTIKLVPESAGGQSNNFTSFENVVEQLESGQIVLTYQSQSSSTNNQSSDTTTLLAQGKYIDSTNHSWAAKVNVWNNGGAHQPWQMGPDNSSSEILFAALWGKTMDVSRTIAVWKTRIANFTGFVIFSFRDFDLTKDDLPGELRTGGTAALGDTTVSIEGFLGNEKKLKLKRGLNLLGTFDLSNGQHDTWAKLGVNSPYVKVSGTLAPKLGVSISNVKGWESELGLEAKLSGEIPVRKLYLDSIRIRETTLEAAISAEVMKDNGKWWFKGWKAELTGKTTWQPPDSVEWLQEVSLELGITVENKKDSLDGERKLEITPRISGTAKITADWLDKLSLNNPLEVTLSVEPKWTRDSTGLKSKVPDFIVKFAFDDIVSIKKFENIFKIHDPKIEWNISEWKRKEGGLKLEAAFDFAQIENVGTIEFEYSKEDSKKVPFGGVPTPFKQADLLALMNMGSNEPLSGGKKAKISGTNSIGKPTWKWKANFDPVALASAGIKIDLVLRTLVGDEILKFGYINSTQHSVRHAVPPLKDPPKDITDFLNNLPALDELSMSFRPGSPGSMVIAGKMTYINSSTDIIISKAESPSKKGFILGIKPHNWSIKNYFPNFSMPALDNLTLSNVALIFSNVEGVMPSTELSDEEYDFYSSAYGKDEFTAVIKPGLNIIASIPSEKLTSNSPLLPLMNKLGIEQGNILLQGSLGDKIKDIYLLAEFPSMHPEGSPDWFKSGQMAIELTGLPSIGLAGVLNVKIKDDDVSFIVKTKAGRDGLILSGGMISQEGWKSPFGIQWLTLNKVVLLLGVTPAGSVQLGFEGDMVIGEKDIHTAVLVALNAVTGVPTNFMLDAESEAGFGLSDLVKLQHKIAEAHSPGSLAIPLDNFPPIYIKDAKLKFAPKDSPELDIFRGMTVGGVLQLKPSSNSSAKDIASVLFDVGDDGLIARANIDSFALGPVKLQEASMDLTLTRSEQYFILAGRSDLRFRECRHSDESY